MKENLPSARWVCTSLLYLFILLATMSASFGENKLPEVQQAQQKLREYFEFSRRPLTEADYEQLNIPVASLDATENFPGIVFTMGYDPEGEAPCSSFPALLLSSGSEWWILETKLNAWSWDEIYITPDRSTIWALLNFYCGGTSGESTILFSSDGGWNWSTLAEVYFGHYQDYYQTFRMDDNGTGVMISGWYTDNGVYPCRICPADPSGENNSDCSGLDYSRTADWGATWETAESVHGKYYSLIKRKNAAAGALMKTRYFDIDTLRNRFNDIPAPVDQNLLSGAQSIAFDEALLKRATTMSTAWGSTFIETEDENGVVYPYLLDRGNGDAQTARIIRLPYPGYHWRVCDEYCYSIGILQAVNDDTEKGWIVHNLTKDRNWISVPLPELPDAPYRFESVTKTGDAALELRVQSLLNGNNDEASDCYVYRSEDGGRSWKQTKVAGNSLVRVGSPHVENYIQEKGKGSGPRVFEKEEIDDVLLDVMEKCLEEVLEKGLQRPAPPVTEPTIEELAELLRKADWMMPLGGNRLALHYALEYEGDSIALLKALLAEGADPATRTSRGGTALDYAVWLNNREAVDLLRAQKADWGGVSEDGYNSLLWLLLEGKGINRGGEWGAGEFIPSIIEHVEFLLTQGADINAKGGYGETPLHQALKRKGFEEVAKLLIERGADIKAKNDGGMTPLYHALEYKQPIEIIQLLHELGADFTIRTPFGYGAVGRALDPSPTDPEAHLRVLEYVVNAGASIDHRTKRDDTPLHVFLVNKKYKDTALPAVRFLIEQGIDPNAVGHEGRTLLHALLRHGELEPQLETLRYLIELGVDVRCVDSEGNTPLHCLTRFCTSLPAIRLLMEAGAEVNAANTAGETPFHRACDTRYGTSKKDAILYLLSQGGDPALRDAEGRTPLDAYLKFMKADEGNEVVRALVEASSDRGAAWHQWGCRLKGMAWNKRDDEAIPLYGEACDAFENAVAHGKEDHLTRLEWGNTVYSWGRRLPGDEGVELYRQACDHYEKASVHKPDWSYAWTNWGLALHGIARRSAGDDAIDLLRQANLKYEQGFQCQPILPEVWDHWGDVLSLLAQKTSDDEAAPLFTAAYEKYQHATEHDPDSEKLWLKWGAALLAQAKNAPEAEKRNILDEARIKYSHAKEQNRWGDASYNLACVAALQGDAEACHRHLRQCVEYKSLMPRKHMENDTDFDSVRELPWFGEILASAPSKD